MKIRSQLFLFLFPVILFSHLLIIAFLNYHWRKELLENFERKLKNSALYVSEFIEKEPSLQKSTSLSPEEFPAPLDFLKKQKVEKIEIISKERIPIPANFSEKKLQEEPLLTFFSEKKERKVRVLTPIFPKESPSFFVSLEASLEEVSEKMALNSTLIFFSVGGSLILLAIFIYFFGKKVADPIQRLNSSALTIAAGQYGEKISLKGALEISELANTLNVMSECLNENMNRLRENSLQKEKWHGEYECSLLLQKLMLEKATKGSLSDAVALEAISFYSDDPKGFLLDVFQKEDILHLQIAEAKEAGFREIYTLLTQYKLPQEKRGKSFLQSTINLSLKNPILYSSSSSFHPPLLWSRKHHKTINTKEPYQLNPGDYLFLANTPLISLKNDLSDMIDQVLKHFAEEGFETVVKMIRKKLSFWIRKEDPEEDIHLICLQWL